MMNVFRAGSCLKVKLVECGMVEVLNILGARASVSELVWYFHVAL